MRQPVIPHEEFMEILAFCFCLTMNLTTVTVHHDVPADVVSASAQIAPADQPAEPNDNQSSEIVAQPCAMLDEEDDDLSLVGPSEEVRPPRRAGNKGRKYGPNYQPAISG